MMDWETWVFVICVSISIICKLGVLYLDTQKDARQDTVAKMNREQRRHPNGKTPARKFKSVNFKGRQKQGNGRAVKGW